MAETKPAGPHDGDDEIMLAASRRLAEQFKRWQSTPPTLASALFARNGFMVLFAAGIIGTAVLTYFVWQSQGALTMHWPVGVAALIVGAMLREFGTVRSFVRTWPAYRNLIDWEKVDELAE